MTRLTRAGALSLLVLLCLSGCSTAAEDAPARPTAGNTAENDAGDDAGSSAAELRDTAVRAAERTAVAVISLDHRDSGAKYDRLLALLSGPARQEWEQQRAERLAEITTGAVTAEAAAVTASGVAALDPGTPTATVLVAGTADVAEKTAPAQERRYRLRMSLTRDNAGEWTVSELQFVP